MGCGSSKLKELQTTTAARQSEIETLRASIATFELETAKHNEEERKAKSEKEATDAFAKSERKRIGAEEEVRQTPELRSRFRLTLPSWHVAYTFFLTIFVYPNYNYNQAT